MTVEVGMVHSGSESHTESPTGLDWTETPHHGVDSLTGSHRALAAQDQSPVRHQPDDHDNADSPYRADTLDTSDNLAARSAAQHHDGGMIMTESYALRART